MRKQLLRSWTFRFVARVLVMAQVLTAIPVLAKAEPTAPAKAATAPAPPPDVTPPPEPPKVTVNRTRPHVDPVPLYAPFGATPTTEEITKARVFGEPLFPLGGIPSEEDNAALAQAIQTFQSGGDVEDVTPFGQFLVEHPGNPWSPSLLMNLGVLYRHTGHFTSATEVLQQAWDQSKAGVDPASDATASRAVGELLRIRTMFGQVEPLAALIADVGDRELIGDAANRLHDAKYTLWVLQNQHAQACPSGPVALDKIRGALGLGGPERHPESLAFPATHDGANLLQMAELSGRMGLKMKMAFRTPGAPIPLPAMVHFKQKHFSAITRLEHGRYLLSDPFLGGEFWISQNALEEETSGYFLVLDQPLPQGWRPATAAESTNARGKCGVPMPSGRQTGACGGLGGGTASGSGGGSGSSGGSSGSGGGSGEGSGCQCSMASGPAMATYSFHMSLANLHITDTPVGYSPPRGPGLGFRVSYNYRESYQPVTFTFSNFGQKWVFDWMAYVEDNPSAPGGTVTLHTPGGGSNEYLSVGETGSTPELEFMSQMVLVSTSPAVRYERRAADGSVQVYAQPDGAMTMPRRIFMTQQIDPQGNAVTFTYDAQLRLTGVTDAIDQVSTISYEMSSDPLKITKVTDPFGRAARFEYNADGMLWRITDVVGIQSSFEYGNGTWIHGLTTPYGTTLFSFDTDHFWTFMAVTATDPLGGTEKIYYGTGDIPATEPASVVPTGFTNNAALNTGASFYWNKRAWMLYPGDFTKAHTMKWRVNSIDNKISNVLASEKSPLENRVWYEHTGTATPNSIGYAGRPAKIGRVLDDGTSQIYKYEYNSRGLPTRITDPLGRETVYDYDTNEIDLLRTKQKSGSSSDLLGSRTYNAQHLPLTMTDAAGQTTTYTYNTAGQVLTITTPPRAGIAENRTTTYTYDTNGYLQSITGPATGATTSYTYDSYGRVRTMTNADSYTVTMDYDALDRPTKVTYPDGTYEQTVYNRLDAEQGRDRLGRWSHTFYDALRRVVSTRDAAGRATTRQWCTCGSLEKVVDADNNATTWERDVQGRVIREIRADGKDRLITYETTTSRLRQIQDSLASRQVTTSDYFLDDQLKQVTYSNTVNATPTVSYTYDPVYGSVATMTDGTGTTTWTYNPITGTPTLGAGRLASVDGPLANDTVSYTFDELGRTASHGLSGFSTTLSYDALGRVPTLGSPVGNFTYTFDGVTRRALSLAYPNSQTTNYLYFGNSSDRRLQEIQHLSPASTILSKLNYTYEAEGDIKTWTQQYGTNPAKVYELGYDPADQLTAATLKSTDPTPVVLKRYAYGYDLLGNRTSDQVDDVVTGGTFNNRNQLTSRQPGGELSFKGTLNEPATVTVAGQPATVAPNNSFQGQAPVTSGTSNVAVAATDPSGNTRTNTYQVSQSGSTTNYTYDANGNLTGDGTKTYEWDAAYRLLRVAQGATELVRFTYDGLGRRSQKIAGGVTHTYVYDGSDVIEERLSTGTTLSYVYGLGVDQALARRDNAGGVTYYLADHLGSVVLETNTSGAASLTREYDPFGNLLQGGSASGYSFTGRELDAESGLLYYRARYYDPKIGRFLSEDPINFLAGPNFYTYVRNNPVNYEDPFGLKEYPDNFMGPLPPGGYYTSQMIKTACGMIPPAPPGANVRNNMRQAASHVDPGWFYDQVKNKGPWDYKQRGSMYQDFGNFNYGATCRSFGFPESTCLREAGRGQQAAGTSQPNWGSPGSRANPWGGTPPYGDDPADAAMIQRGMDACKCLLSNR